MSRPPETPPAAPWLTVLGDGREIIDTTAREGWNEYRRRVTAMLARQGGVCCLSRACPLCPGALRREDAVFEHQTPRGMGAFRRDDRITRDGQPINGAAHWQCNQWKGSRHVDY